MTYEEISQKRSALRQTIVNLIDELDQVQQQYDRIYVDHLRATAEDGLMNAEQIALYADITVGRVRNVWSAAVKLKSEVHEGERKSLRSDVDVMLQNRWSRSKK